MVKNSKDHFYTLLIKLPFRWEVFALKYVEKTLLKVSEKQAQEVS